MSKSCRFMFCSVPKYLKKEERKLGACVFCASSYERRMVSWYARSSLKQIDHTLPEIVVSNLAISFTCILFGSFIQGNDTLPRRSATANRAAFVLKKPLADGPSPDPVPQLDSVSEFARCRKTSGKTPTEPLISSIGGNRDSRRFHVKDYERDALVLRSVEVSAYQTKIPVGLVRTRGPYLGSIDNKLVAVFISTAL